jgi:tripartite-type tricarboxylate transporter receptor subunit TctC
MIIPWPPGQATDLAGRLGAQILAEQLGQPVVPENRAGAGGMIGTEAAVRAAPDGYTLLAGSSGPISINPLFNRTSYDPERDLVPVTMLGLSIYALVVRAAFPAADIGGFLALLRANPGTYTYASSGTGATTHLITEIFNHRAGLQAVHVPFSGSAPALAAVLGGQVDYTIDTLAATNPLVRGGALRSFGISSARTTALAPGQLPLAEVAGLPGFDVGAWIGVMAPAATPRPVIERLAAALEHGMAEPAARARFAAAGLEVETRGPEAFATFLRAHRANFAEIIRTANIGIDDGAPGRAPTPAPAGR